ncbi:mercuric reductase [bacterium]|nr:mercuric reductase [bacterium]MCI0602347.1 mercuric reductase [bacterium]
MDAENQILISNAHPKNWVNPKPEERYNLVVIGAGTAGLVCAAGAAVLGGKVALVERHFMGGDCLNTGCVPSKALIRCSRAAAAVASANQFGIQTSNSVIDFERVMKRVRSVRAKISFHDSVKRFTDLGVDVFLGQGSFVNEQTISVEGALLRFKKAVIATGARPDVPEIPGLKEAGYFTNETIFEITSLPERLAVIGGGPLGCELAQAFARLGSQVFVFHNKDHILDREDADAAEVLQTVLTAENIQLFLSSQISTVEKNQSRRIHFSVNDKEQTIEVSDILVGAGRVPNTEGLKLEAAGVQYNSRKGVLVNDYLQTTNKRIYASGDVCMRWKFTHAAEAASTIVLQNALFHRRKKLSSLSMPWCTYTDPEIAHVGMYEQDAKKKGIEVATFKVPLKDVDRAITDGEELGFIKIHTKKSTDQILGATIVAAHAGEMINEITLAMTNGVGLKRLASVIHPYPTESEAVKHAAVSYYRARLTPVAKRILTKWLELTR